MTTDDYDELTNRTEQLRQAHRNLIENEGGRPVRKILYMLVGIVSLGLVLNFLALRTLSRDIETRAIARAAENAQLARQSASIETTLELIKSALCPNQPVEQECVPESDGEAQGEALVLAIVNYQAKRDGCSTFESFAEIVAAVQSPDPIVCDRA